MSVLLDIPAANPGGSTVTLATAPGTYGSVPVSVQVPADQISAGFTFTANMMIGTETVSATLGGTVMATVDVAQGGGVVINEVDYDQPGSDTDEFVEIYNATSASVDLTDLALVMVNGAGSDMNNPAPEYSRVDLAPVGMLGAGEFLVVGSPTLVAGLPMGTKSIMFMLDTNNVQNGAPDAVGLLDKSTGELIDALAYEGAVAFGDINGVGVRSFVEGSPLSDMIADTNDAPGSLIRFPDGADGDNSATDWVFTSTSTPGLANMQ
jgi:hypothetical protein